MSRMYTVSSRSSKVQPVTFQLKGLRVLAAASGDYRHGEADALVPLKLAAAAVAKAGHAASISPRAVRTPAVFSTTPPALGPASYRTIEGLLSRSVEAPEK